MKSLAKSTQTSTYNMFHSNGTLVTGCPLVTSLYQSRSSALRARPIPPLPPQSADGDYEQTPRHGRPTSAFTGDRTGGTEAPETRDGAVLRWQKHQVGQYLYQLVVICSDAAIPLRVTNLVGIAGYVLFQHIKKSDMD